MRTLLVIIFLVSLVLGYGYYHAATHGSLHVSLVELSQGRNYETIRSADLSFLDSQGNFLAKAKSDPLYGVIRLVHPRIGNCVAEERAASSSPAGPRAWQECFDAQSTWMVGWIGRTRYLDIKVDRCDLKRVPVTVRERNDEWWLWWVPFGHIGGKPYRLFSLSLSIDRSKCTVVEYNSPGS